jgi:hypothetical protein
VSGILRIVKGGKGTAGTTVAPAGEFKPRTSPKVRFGFAMNIYTEPAAPATETATDSTAPQVQSWRDTLPIHPAAELFPPLSEAELAALGKDIRKHGLTSSIAVWSDGKSPEQLLDGRGRLDAIEIEIGPAIVGPPSIMAGKDFLAVNKVIVLDRSVDPYAYVISANIHRRHLTVEQKHELIAKLIETDPTKSNRQIAKTVKVDHKTVASVRAEKEGRGEIPHVETRTDSKGRAQPATKPSRGRFTLEVIKQIKNLVERGASREDIATTIGVTTSSLQSACWRLGISLRRKARTTPTPPPPEDTRDDIGPASSGEIAHLNARIDELQADKRRLEIENTGLRSEVEETKAVRKPEGEGEGEGEGSELGNLLLAWDRASQGAREKFKARVGLVAVKPPAKAMDDGLDIPEFLRRAAP